LVRYLAPCALTAKDGELAEGKLRACGAAVAASKLRMGTFDGVLRSNVGLWHYFDNRVQASLDFVARGQLN